MFKYNCCGNHRKRIGSPTSVILELTSIVHRCRGNPLDFTGKQLFNSSRVCRVATKTFKNTSSGTQKDLNLYSIVKRRAALSSVLEMMLL